MAIIAILFHCVHSPKFTVIQNKSEKLRKLVLINIGILLHVTNRLIQIS